MNNLKQSLSSYIDNYTQLNNQSPSDEEITKFKKEFWKKYYRDYYHRTKKQKKVLKITFNQKDAEIFNQYCKTKNKSGVKLAKEIIINHIKNPNQQILSNQTEQKLQDLIIQIRRIGNNINQQTKLAHQKGFLTYEHTFNQTLIRLSELEDIILNNVSE